MSQFSVFQNGQLKKTAELEKKTAEMEKTTSDTCQENAELVSKVCVCTHMHLYNCGQAA